MKIKAIIISIFILTLSAVFIFSCGDGSGKWVAKIKGDEITLSSFNSWYYTQNKQFFGDMTDADIDKRAANPEEVARYGLLDKRAFLENIISQRLVYQKAVEDGYLKDKELEVLLQMAKEAFVVQYYISKKYKDQLTPTELEIGKVYQEQKARFKNAPVDQAEQYIRQQLMMQKFQLKSKEIVDLLKEEGGIKRNLDLIGKKEDSADKEKEANTSKTDIKIEKPAVKEEPKK